MRGSDGVSKEEKPISPVTTPISCTIFPNLDLEAVLTGQIYIIYIVTGHLRRGFANSMAWGQYNGNGKRGSLLIRYI